MDPAFFKTCLDKLARRSDLTLQEAESAFDLLLESPPPEAEVIRFLTGLRDKKETASEITGAVRSLRRRCTPLACKRGDILDTCGTGGDRKNTFNISTAASFVVAGAGTAVAKHGGSAVSSNSGSADVLKACGVNIQAEPEVVVRCIDEIGIGFLFAPAYHPALKALAPIRKKIGTKTIFNILGPLLNPAGAKKQVIGVFDARLLPILADVLKGLGSEAAAIVHGDDGLDELTLTATSRIYFLKAGSVVQERFDPRSVGYPFCSLSDLQGSSPEENARRLRKVLKGHSQPLDHCVHLNAALAILVSGKASEFKEALLMAQDSISSGRAFEKLEALVEMTHSS